MTLPQIVIADCNELSVAGIRFLLQQEHHATVSSMVKDYQGLLKAITPNKPAILIIDPYGIQGFTIWQLEKIQQENKQLYLLIITSTIEREALIPLIKGGTVAIITKNCSQREIIAAFEAALLGEKFLCNKIVDLIMDDDTSGSGELAGRIFSEREISIIGFIAEGLSTKEIGEKLHLSPHTVHSHRKNILKKLDARTPVELIVKAAKARLITF